MSKITRKIIVILLILNLICASVNPAIFGLISHAEEGEAGEEDIGVQLGIDKTEWSTTQVNDVNFTITMDTSEKEYAAPYFEIKLPKEVEDVEIIKSNSVNRLEDFVINLETKIEDEQKVITISLENSFAEEYRNNLDVEIIIQARIKTNSLIPSKTEKIVFYGYNGYGASQESSFDVKLNAKEGLIVGVVATDEKGSVIAMNRETKTMQTISGNITLRGVVINNTAKTINLQKIKATLGKENIKNEICDIDIAPGETKGVFSMEEKDITNISESTSFSINFFYYNESNALTTDFAEIYFEKIDEIGSLIKNEEISAKINLSDKNLYLGEILDGTITIENKTTSAMDVNLSLKIPKEVVTNENSFIKVFKDNEGNEQSETVDFTEGEEIRLNTINIPAGKTIKILTSFEYVKYQKEEPSKIEVALHYGNTTEISQETLYIASENITFNKPYSLTEEVLYMDSNKNGKTLEVGEEIEYRVYIGNKEDRDIRVNVELLGIENLKIYSIKIVDKNENLVKQLIAPSLDGKFDRIEILKQEGNIPGEVKLIVSAKVKENPEDGNIVVSAKVTGKQINPVTTDTITNTINGVTSNAKASTISGSAWIDENGNGAIDNNEALLKDVQAVLVNSATAETVASARTDNNGQYEFTEVEEGNYVVKFNYNTKTFKTTSYKNEGAAEEANSDAITTVQNNTATTKTDIIQVLNGSEENANIGLVLNKTFDLAINSGISKVTVDNEQGSNAYDFNNINLAKVEIEGEFFKDSLVLVEYEVAVTNLSEVEGYATKISSKIPEGMEFIAEVNSDWYEGEDGKIYSSALANEKLAQGETKTIKLVLAREMTEGTIQAPVINVQIEEKFNDYLIKDNKPENDKSEATIIISLTTGNVQKYIWLAILVIAIITVGLFGTIKIVKIDINNLTKKGKE